MNELKWNYRILQNPVCEPAQCYYLIFNPYYNYAEKLITGVGQPRRQAAAPALELALDRGPGEDGNAIRMK